MAKYKKKTAEERKQEIEQITSGMQDRIDSYFHTPDQVKDYLSFMGKFHQYSLRNSVLIDNQFPGAEAVRSFKFWKDKGFPVNKGEKGLKILVPNRLEKEFKDEEDQWKGLKKATTTQKQKIERGDLPTREGRLYFSVGSVFDVSQTNATAKDLPQIFPNRWLEGSFPNMDSLQRGMGDVAKENGIKIIPPKEELGAAKGVSYTLTNEVALNPRNSDKQKVKTLLHELTHAKLHTKETHHKYTAPEKEFQAEMTAYTVTKKFGIDTSDYSLNYLHSWTSGRKMEDKEQLLKEVHETAHSFIDTIEKRLVSDRENEQGQEKQQPAQEGVYYDAFPHQLKENTQPQPTKGSDHMNTNQLEAMRMHALERVKAVHDPRDLDQDYKQAASIKDTDKEATYRLESKVKSRPDFELVHDKESNQVTAYQVNERDDSRTRLNRKPVSMDYISSKHERGTFELQQLTPLKEETVKEKAETTQEKQEPVKEKAEPSQEKQEPSMSKEDYKETYKDQVAVAVTPAGEKPLEQESDQREEYKALFKTNVLNLLEGKKPEADKENQGPEREKGQECTNPFPVVSKEQRQQMKDFEASHSYHDVYKLRKEALSEIKEMDLSPKAAENLKKLEAQLDKEYKQDKKKDPNEKGFFKFRGMGRSQSNEQELERA